MRTGSFYADREVRRPPKLRPPQRPRRDQGSNLTANPILQGQAVQGLDLLCRQSYIRVTAAGRAGTEPAGPKARPGVSVTETVSTKPFTRVHSKQCSQTLWAAVFKMLMFQREIHAMAGIHLHADLYGGASLSIIKIMMQKCGALQTCLVHANSIFTPRPNQRHTCRNVSESLEPQLYTETKIIIDMTVTVFLIWKHWF